MVAVLLALISAVSYGCSDFAAGLATRRASVLRVTLISEAATVAVVGLALAVTGAHPPDLRAVVWGCVAGLGGVCGALALYVGFRHAAFSVAGPLSAVRVGLLHGQLPPKEKEQTMDAFRRGAIDVLVATTVIEVGVDIPNATVVVIEDADRFGIAQLHQLRGRVGRGDARARCFLLADRPTDDGQRRLAALAATTDGFELAERDLELRGEGQLLGFRQS